MMMKMRMPHCSGELQMLLVFLSSFLSSFVLSGADLLSGVDRFPYFDVDVACSRTVMVVNVHLNGTGRFGKDIVIYMDKLKGYPGCQAATNPKDSSLAVFTLPLEDDLLYTCGTTKLHNKLTDTKVFYHRVIIEDTLRETRESAVVKCIIPSGERSPLVSSGRVRRQIHGGGSGGLDNFTESAEELIDWSGNYTGRAPIPLLNIAVKQNGRLVDTALNVSPGTPLEMIIYLDETSAQVYGLLTTFLRVTDNTPRNQEEIIILNGCSIDPYIFANFETADAGKSLAAKFRAFKFPESSYVLFVGTVSVCLNQCQGVQCGDGSIGFGRKRRSVPFTARNDPNRIFEAELSAFIRVDYEKNLGPMALKVDLPAMADSEAEGFEAEQNIGSSSSKQENILDAQDGRPASVGIGSSATTSTVSLVSVVILMISMVAFSRRH